MKPKYERNKEICERRLKDSKKYSYGKLADIYNIDKAAVIRIVKQSDKWLNYKG